MADFTVYHQKSTLPCRLDWAGVSPALKLLMSETETIAPLRAPVLICGETGTGKELVAKGLHSASGRKGRFVSVNCACFTDTLLEDTLFGHEKGSFTDAHRIREGVIELAHNGTLFLDEIGEMPISHQAALLRVLDERKIRRVGGSKELAVRFRLVCATNRELESIVERGRFRADLYHRISTFQLITTPLRERIEDVVPIAEQLLLEMRPELGKRILDAQAKSRLMQYDWRGNVRELKNILYRVAALSLHTTLTARDFEIPKADKPPHTFKFGRVSNTELVRFVHRFNGNISKAAQTLGVARTTLRDRLNRFEKDILAKCTNPDEDTVASKKVLSSAFLKSFVL